MEDFCELFKVGDKIQVLSPTEFLNRTTGVSLRITETDTTFSYFFVIPFSKFSTIVMSKEGRLLSFRDTRYSDNGLIEKISPISDNLWESRTYHRNGSIKTISFLGEDGLQTGIGRFWDKRQNLESETTYSSGGKLQKILFYGKGEVYAEREYDGENYVEISGRIKTEMKDGIFIKTIFTKSGKVRRVIRTFQDGTSRHCVFNDNGRAKMVFHMSSRKFHGTGREWRVENGNFTEILFEYKNGVLKKQRTRDNHGDSGFFETY